MRVNLTVGASLLAIFLALLSGCTSPAAGVQLPALPAWQQPADRRVLSAVEVRREVASLLPGVPVLYSDDRYTLISHAWLERYLAWTVAAGDAARVTYTPESFDCDEFALMFDACVRLAAARAKVQTSPLIARVVVSFPDERRHALIAVATDRGLYLIEPQPRAASRLVPLERFPHRIRSLVLGDFNP